jgi:glycine oxidase
VAPVRGQIVCVDAPHPALRSIVWGPGAYLVPKLDGSVVVGATSEHAGFDRRVTAAGVAALLEAATRLVPALGDASFRSAWAGLRPATPDGLPLVGPLPELDGLAVAAGHYRNGVLLSPVTGRMVADGILGKGWAEPAFLPERWLRPARSADASGT